MVRSPARPHTVSRFGTENRETEPSGRLASPKLVIHVKYGIFVFIYLFDLVEKMAPYFVGNLRPTEDFKATGC